MLSKRNIKIVVDNYMCSACGMCGVVCPRQAIEFKFTSIGRLKATVNNACINCGMCLNTCPSANTTFIEQNADDLFVGHIKSTYIGRATDALIYKNAQSGGVCTAISYYLLENNVVDAVLVCQRTREGDITSRGYLVRDEKMLCHYQGSHYINTNILSVLNKVNNDEKVAVIGLPCQIKAVTLYCETYKKHINVVFKIGLICDRIHCKGYLDTILSYCSDRVVNIYWRKKDFVDHGKYYPYKTAPIVLFDVNKKKHIIPNSFRFAIKDLFTSPRCRVCVDKLNVNADIVLGDPWCMKGVDWEHGDSVLITRTDLGESIIGDAIARKSICCKKSNKEELIEGQFIEERKKRVYLYSKVMRELSFRNIPYMTPIKEREFENVSDGLSYNQAFKDIKQFIMMEHLPHFLVIKYAQYCVAQKTGVWHRSLALVHILNVFIHFLNKVKRIFK